jgi:hypothetical protein
MANRLLDPDRAALLAEQSRIRLVVRRVAYRHYPAHASPRLVERAARIVFRQLGLEPERR